MILAMLLIMLYYTIIQYAGMVMHIDVKVLIMVLQF